MLLRVSQVVNKEGHAIKVMGDIEFFIFYNFSLEEGAGRTSKRREVIFLCRWFCVIKIKKDE